MREKVKDGIRLAREIETSILNDSGSWKMIGSLPFLLQRIHEPGRSVAVAESGFVLFEGRGLELGWRARRIVRKAVLRFVAAHPVTSDKVIEALRRPGSRT